MKRIISFSIFLIGFTAMAGQIIFVREFLIVCYGNELSIGIILADWLICGAIGSFILGRFTDRLKSRIPVFLFCQIALAFLFPLTITAIRLIKTALVVSPGEIIAFSPILIVGFIILSPVCAILGFMFSLACHIYESRSLTGATRIGRVYFFEAIGSMAGGMLTSFILVRLLNSIQIAAFISLLNVLAALLLAFRGEGKKAYIISAVSIVFVVITATWFLGGWNYLDRYSLSKEWQGYNLVASKNSIYGNVAVTKTDDQASFFANGLRLYTVPDKLTSEEAIHFALLEHPDPKRVLLIGGGAGGLIEEALKHPIERIDYVELDPLVINMSREYLFKTRPDPSQDDRVRVINLDGRFFVKRTSQRYDCIIIDLGDPYTAGLNRFYTVEFFKEASGILKKNGVISFGVSSAENYISKELNDFLSSIYATLKKVFPSVMIIPGDTAYFLASNQKDMLTYDYHVLMKRAAGRKLYLEYVREYYLFSKLSPQRVSYIEEAVRRNKHVKMNYDFRPISYYYDIIFWSSRFRDSLFSRILKGITEKAIWIGAAIFYTFIILFGLIRGRYKKSFKRVILMAVMVMGLSSLALQIVVLVSFQIIYGYLFYKLGIILTFFMAGLAAGSLGAIKLLPRLKNDKRLFIITQCAICLYLFILPLFLWAGSCCRGAFTSWVGSNIFFPFLSIVAGLIGGFQFPLANKLYLNRGEDVGRAGGLTYGADLFGASIGAILTGALLIPVLGIPKTCLAISLMNLAVLVGLIF